MRLAHLRQRLHDLGAAPGHEGRVLRAWVQVRSIDNKHRKAEDFLPPAVHEALLGIFDELRGRALLGYMLRQAYAFARSAPSFAAEHSWPCRPLRYGDIVDHLPP